MIDIEKQCKDWQEEKYIAQHKFASSAALQDYCKFEAQKYHHNSICDILAFPKNFYLNLQC